MDKSGPTQVQLATLLDVTLFAENLHQILHAYHMPTKGEKEQGGTWPSWDLRHFEQVLYV